MPGEVLLLKMWETLIEKGVGGLVIPYYVIWKDRKLALNKIELDKQCRIATFKAEKEIDQLRNTQLLITDDSSPISDRNNFPIDTVQDLVRKSEIKKLIREEINVAQAINYANKRLLDDESTLPDDEINPDWLHMWRDNASKVSDEEVQSLWGHVLAQEFIKPGRYSLRLLDFLKTISKADALLIERFAAFVIQGGLIFGVKQEDETAFLEGFDFSADDLNFLEEMNLISGASTLGMIATLKNLREEEGSFLARINIDQNRSILLSDDNKDNIAQYKFFQLTKIGQEVFSLININVSDKYINWLIQQYTEDFKVEIYVNDNGDYKLENVFEKND